MSLVVSFLGLQHRKFKFATCCKIFKKRWWDWEANEVVDGSILDSVHGIIYFIFQKVENNRINSTSQSNNWSINKAFIAWIIFIWLFI